MASILELCPSLLERRFQGSLLLEGECVVKIIEYVADILKTHRKPNEVLRDPRLRSQHGVHRSMCHALRVVNQRFDAPE